MARTINSTESNDKTKSKSKNKPKAGKSKYSVNKLAKSAINQLQGSLSGLKINDLDSYSTTPVLREDYAPFIDYNSILERYNTQSDAAWDLSRQQQIQAMNQAEAQNYADTHNAVAQMRNALAGSASSGANVGAANATALQALLGLGQQNAQATTEGMQNYQNTSKEAAAARAANAVSALDSAREGMNSMYDNATSAYGADHTYGVQGVAEAVGTLGSAMEQSQSAERQNNATNQTNLAVEQTTKNTTNTSKSNNVNKNINLEGKYKKGK